MELKKIIATTIREYLNEMTNADQFSKLVGNGGEFCVFIVANKNNVNQWQAETLDDAEKSIQLFLEMNPHLNRSIANIYKTISYKIERVRGKKIPKIERELIKTIDLKK